MQQLVETTAAESGSKAHAPRAVIVIGASTGGPTALTQVLPKFPRNLQASIIVVQQMRPGFTKLLARQLNGISELPIEEAEDLQPLKCGAALLAPGCCTVMFHRSEDLPDQPFILQIEDVSASVERMRKRVDQVMISAAEQFGSRAMGVILTGIGDDGRDGMRMIRERGGKTVAQDESSSIVFDMPRAAIDAGIVDEIVPLWSIADRIIDIVGDS